ncbi:MAG TPA: gluconate 2-dehydrogenase subunit 3 family protein [Candidatus Sulfotelmatobacter sp.]|nr:gluconate 2-dehydrogenase subunit 3 family protein [Candidatus Sulfotelmatobacter sp.]
MQRRDLLRLLATGTALQLAPAKWMLLAREARALVATRESLRTLDPHQEATVKAMADMIIPRTDTPGASDVGVSEFIDLILTEWYGIPERTHFLNGLAATDSRARSLFGKDFVDCSPEQRSEMLIELGAKMLQDAALAAVQSARSDAGLPEANFYSDFRRLTLTAYYTSEAGATQELHFEVIPEQYQGCNITPASQEVPKQP